MGTFSVAKSLQERLQKRRPQAGEQQDMAEDLVSVTQNPRPQKMPLLKNIVSEWNISFCFHIKIYNK